MGRYIVSGGKPIVGELHINGGKNAILPILAATVLNGGVNIIHNCPKISDIYIAAKILEDIGCSVNWDGTTMIINSADACNYNLKEDFVIQMRSSIVFMGSLLGRFKKACLAYPGGCEIGERPIDLHLKAIKKMGGIIEDESGFIFCKADKLKGTKINLNFPSVGATENIMLAAVMAEGRTIIYNAAREPEIVDLQNFLVKMGGKVYGAGNDTIYIDGVKKLTDVEYTVIPDRIEAGTYLMAAAITGGELFLKDVCPHCMRQVLLRLTETGCLIKEEKTGLYIEAPKKLKPVDIVRTLPYPGFPTDLQPQFMSLLTLAKGTSIIIETVFESRFKHIIELCRMGADIDVEGQTAVIKGVENLRGACVTSRDLRGGAALILAGLHAEGETIICNSNYVERGYEHIEKALSSLGANIKLIED